MSVLSVVMYNYFNVICAEKIHLSDCGALFHGTGLVIELSNLTIYFRKKKKNISFLPPPGQGKVAPGQGRS